jgi:hypothetical protein
MKERKEYELKAEIIVKQLKAKIYELESKALEAKLKAQSSLNELDTNLKSLKKQRETLDSKFDDLKNAEQEKWNEMVIEFEGLLKNISSDKQEFYEKAEQWFQDLGSKIEILEEQAKDANENIKQGLHEQIKGLKVQRQHLYEKLRILKESQGDTWNNAKLSLDEGIIKIKDSVSKAFDHFKK